MFVSVCSWADGRSYGVGSRPNPASGCTYTREYGLETVTFDLWGNVRVVKDPTVADLLVYVSKTGYADLVVTWVDKPSGCGQWHRVEKGESFTICFVNSEDEATLIIRYGNAEKEYSGSSLPY